MIPRVVALKGKRQVGAITSAERGDRHPSRWIQTDIVTEWFNHFLTKTHPRAESPVLLVLHGHNRHAINFDVIEVQR